MLEFVKNNSLFNIAIMPLSEIFVQVYDQSRCIIYFRYDEGGDAGQARSGGRLETLVPTDYGVTIPGWTDGNRVPDTDHFDRVG